MMLRRRIAIVLSAVVCLLGVAAPANANPVDLVSCLLHWSDC
jgi:hypothetical protein